MDMEKILNNYNCNHFMIKFEKIFLIDLYKLSIELTTYINALCYKKFDLIKATIFIFTMLESIDF